MFPESFAEKWILDLSRPGDVVLDPFCGRGTTPFQAILMDRRAIGCDVNDVAYCLTKAKTAAPRLLSVERRLSNLEDCFDARSWRHPAARLPVFFAHAFHRRTLQQICYLREVLDWKNARTDAMIAALVLGSLHGEMDKSSSYLSNQMPRTISTKPDYSMRFWEQRGLLPPRRDVFSLLRERARFRYRSVPPIQRAKVLHCDMRRLPNCSAIENETIKCVITSPPYMDVTNFEEDQWLRLWFLGGPDKPTRGRVSRDDRHTNASAYWEFIADMWRSLGRVMAANAHAVVRIGSRTLKPDVLCDTLMATSVFSGRYTTLVSADVSELKNRQTDTFRPGTSGCLVEVDAHIVVR